MSKIKIICLEKKVFFINVAALIVAFLVASFGINTAQSSESGQREIRTTRLDAALRKSFFERDLDNFEKNLNQGGDPTVWFERSRSGWVFCAATESGLESYLQLIIAKGIDVNFRQTDMHPSSSLPLACAVRYGNILALEMLVEAGADPAVRLCDECDDRAPGSVLDQAAVVGKYEMAIWLLDKGSYSDAQIETVIYGIENFPFDNSNPRNILRLELAARIRELGFEVNPWTEDGRAD